LQDYYTTLQAYQEVILQQLSFNRVLMVVCFGMAAACFIGLLGLAVTRWRKDKRE
jgi:uncharacterized membrane protein YjjP (DUF1212 family)